MFRGENDWEVQHPGERSQVGAVPPARQLGPPPHHPNDRLGFKPVRRPLKPSVLRSRYEFIEKGQRVPVDGLFVGTRGRTVVAQPPERLAVRPRHASVAHTGREPWRPRIVLRRPSWADGRPTSMVRADTTTLRRHARHGAGRFVRPNRPERRGSRRWWPTRVSFNETWSS